MWTGVIAMRCLTECLWGREAPTLSTRSTRAIDKGSLRPDRNWVCSDLSDTALFAPLLQPRW
jgi:hypothetical protein